MIISRRNVIVIPRNEAGKDMEMFAPQRCSALCSSLHSISTAPSNGGNYSKRICRCHATCLVSTLIFSTQRPPRGGIYNNAAHAAQLFSLQHKAAQWPPERGHLSQGVDMQPSRRCSTRRHSLHIDSTAPRNGGNYSDVPAIEAVLCQY